MSNTLDVVKEKINGILAKYPAADEPLTKFAGQVGIAKEYIVIGAIVAIPLLLIVVLSGSDFFIDLIGFLYPCYASIKAIESTEKKDDTLWLTYWLVFGIFKIVECFADFLVSYIPYYTVMKAAFLVWCFYPKTQGATVIYASLIKPYVVPHLGAMGEDETKKEK